MCYNAAQLTHKILKDAQRLNASPEEIDSLEKKWDNLKSHAQNYYHISGFSHQKIIAFYQENESLNLDLFQWGIIPNWAKTEKDAKDIQSKTVNVRGETMQEKASFKNSAINNRCIIPLSGFFEHHAKNGKTIPHYIWDKKH